MKLPRQVGHGGLASGTFLFLGLVAVTARSRAGEHAGRRPRVVRLGPAATVGLAAGIVGAVGAPLAVAVGSRTSGQEITGFSPGGAPGVSVEDLEARLANGSSDAAELVALADAYVADGRLADASPLYRRALDQEPDNVRALVGVGVLLVLADRADGAILAFDRALAVARDHPDALIYRALARARLEGAGSSGVRVDAERFLVVAPGDPRAGMARRLLGPSASDGP